MSNKLAITLFLLILGSLCFIYWVNANAKASVEDIKKAALALVDSAKVETNATHKVGIARINARLTTNKYTKPQTRLKTSFDAFTAAWEKTGALSDKAAGFRRDLEENFKWVEDSCSILKLNQLLSVIVIWAIYVLTLYLILFTDILRDAVGNNIKILDAQIYPVPGIDPVDVKPPFSLARTQLTIWIAIIASVYIYAVLWDQLPIVEISSTTLLLMGISAGTLATGVIMDTTEIQQGIPRSQDEPSSGNFFKDILSDNNGISIHRFQNVVWTVIAIIVYFYRYGNPPPGSAEGLPVLDTTLIALTGISSATYLTLKARENLPSTDIIKELKITLAADKTLPPADQAWIAANGLDKPAIDISDPSGTNIIHPLPSPAKPKFDFVAENIKSGKYTKIRVSWTGTLSDPKKTLTLTGAWDGVVDGKTTTMTIPMK